MNVRPQMTPVEQAGFERLLIEKPRETLRMAFTAEFRAWLNREIDERRNRAAARRALLEAT